MSLTLRGTPDDVNAHAHEERERFLQESGVTVHEPSVPRAMPANTPAQLRRIEQKIDERQATGRRCTASEVADEQENVVSLRLPEPPSETPAESSGIGEPLLFPGDPRRQRIADDQAALERKWLAHELAEREMRESPRMAASTLTWLAQAPSRIIARARAPRASASRRTVSRAGGVRNKSPGSLSGEDDPPLGGLRLLLSRLRGRP